MASIDPTQHLASYLSRDFWQKETGEIMLNPHYPPTKDWCHWLQQKPCFRHSVAFQSSGVTAEPKWVLLPKASLLASATAVNQWINYYLWPISSNNTCWLLVLPLWHVGGFAIMARSYLKNIPVATLTEKWQITLWCNFLEQHEGVLTSIVPTQAIDLYHSQRIAPKHRHGIFVGGGQLDSKILLQLQGRGWNIIPTYGMTEACSQIATAIPSSHTDFNKNQLTILPHVTVKKTANNCLMWRSKQLSYHTITQDKKITSIDYNHWATTKDQVKISNNQLQFQQRQDRMVKILGELVDINFIEQKLRDICQQQSAAIDVTEIILITVPDARRGAQLVPITTLPKNVINGCNLSSFNGIEQLANWFFIRTIPRSSLGKVQYFACQKMYLAQNNTT